MIARKVPAEYITNEIVETPDSDRRKVESWWYVEIRAPNFAGISPEILKADGHFRKGDGGGVADTIFALPVALSVLNNFVLGYLCIEY